MSYEHLTYRTGRGAGALVQRAQEAAVWGRAVGAGRSRGGGTHARTHIERETERQRDREACAQRDERLTD